ncbi:MAG: hypothetical protein CMP23_12960 [Rickettsiales bacterium]|nr:hypothetical protein [Rickettsiales bacterium]
MRDDGPVERRLQAGGLEQRLLIWEGDGPTLLLLHGFLDCAGSFAPLVRFLPPDYRIVALDFRGHGESAWVGPEAHYNFYDYVRDVRAVIDQLDRERIFLLGHSMGGGVSLLFAGSWPEEVERLVVVEGLGPPNESVEDGPARMRRWIREERRVADRGTRSFPDLLSVARRLQVRQPALEGERALELAGWLAHEQQDGWTWRHDPRHQVRNPKIYRSSTYAPFVAEIGCPVLLVTGSESWYRWPDLEERRSHLRDWRRVDIEGASHMIHHDCPEPLAAAVASFLAGAEPAAVLAGG